MNMEINISDYLSEEAIKEAALDSLRYHFAQQLRNEARIETVLANLTSEYIFTKVCEGLDKDYIEKAIAEGIKKAIESDYIKWQVFRRKDAWDRTESPAVKILDEVLENSRDLIEHEVEWRIKEYPFRELREEIEDTIYGVICRKLREES